jgi:hypothetical protein
MLFYKCSMIGYLKRKDIIIISHHSGLSERSFWNIIRFIGLTKDETWQYTLRELDFVTTIVHKRDPVNVIYMTDNSYDLVIITKTGLRTSFGPTKSSLVHDNLSGPEEKLWFSVALNDLQYKLTVLMVR